MNRYAEKVYRVTRRKDGPTLAEQKGQLVRLKQDLEQFKARQAGAAVVASLQARIRDLEASVSRAEGAGLVERQARRHPAEDETGDPASPPAGGIRATSSRFPPRGRPGRGF